MSANDKIITVRPQEVTNTRQQLPNFEGISAATAGATGLCMHLVIGVATMRLRHGVGLAEAEAGDFIFIPADVPHQPVNLSDTEEVVAVVARNDPNEQESVVLYDAGQP